MTPALRAALSMLQTPPTAPATVFGALPADSIASRHDSSMPVLPATPAPTSNRNTTSAEGSTFGIDQRQNAAIARP